MGWKRYDKRAVRLAIVGLSGGLIMQRILGTLGCLALLALPGAAEPGGMSFDLNKSDLRADWNGFMNKSTELATPASQAVAACHNCGMDSAVYSRVLHYRCNSGSYITDEGAKDVAARAARGSIDVDAFLNAYYRTCRFNSAVEIGEGNRSGTLSASVYNRVLHYNCKSGSYITDEGARDIAVQAAANGIDVDSFLSAYYRTCLFNRAVEVGRGQRAGTLSASVYFRVLHYNCRSGNYITDSGAQDVATLAAKRSINVDVFLNVYYRTCKFNSALEVACR